MIRRFPTAAWLAAACLALAPAAHADIAVSGTAEPTTYARGRTNTYLLDLHLVSEAFGGADALYFTLPHGVTLSAVRKRNTFSWCADGATLVMGMGSGEGGWYQLGYPVLDGCGSFSGSSAPGEEQIVLIDVDVPSDYAGDLPIVVNALGDGIGDPPNEASLTLTMSDAGTPLVWTFDDVAAPALPDGWSTVTAGAGIAWTTQAQDADTSPNTAYASAPAASGEEILVGPVVSVPPAGAELQFRHRFATDEGRDGGVLEIAIDGGAFEDIVAAGGSFGAGGYTGELASGAECSGSDANPLAGRAAWSGSQDTFAAVAVALPAAAAGHQAQFRWRFGADCAGNPAASDGWWIDSIRISSDPPRVSTPSRLAVSTDTGVQRVELLDIGNVGSGSLTYQVTVADGDCSTPSDPGWLHVDEAGGSVAGGARADVPVALDSSGLADGAYSALLCVATNDADTPVRTVPLRLGVAAGSCAAADRIFANGFDDASNGACGNALRTYDERDAFLAHVADGYDENAFTGLRTGYVNGPIDFGTGAYAYAVTAAPHTDFGDMYLFAGSGVLSAVAAGDTTSMTVTFTGAPVTALGGNFWGQLFQTLTRIEMNLQPPTTIVLTLGDGTTETLVATGQQDFRGFLATQPIASLTIGAPEADADGDQVWGVFDNLIVGRAR